MSGRMNKDKPMNRETLATNYHAYDVEVFKDGQKSTIRIEARNRTSASSKASKAGYKVMSVNMIG